MSSEYTLKGSSSCIHNSHEMYFTKILTSLQKTGGKFTKYQVQVLMTMFKVNAFPGDEEICQIARSLSTTKERIKHWFEKRRYCKRREGVLHKGEYSYQ